MAQANDYLATVYRAAFNAEFMQPAMEAGSAFADWIGGPLDASVCERFARTVGNDNCLSFEGMTLRIPGDRHCCHYINAKVTVIRRIDDSLVILHGWRKLAEYSDRGQLRSP